ncbi:MAG: hypothetical protein PHV62_09300 [Sulfuricurvum sp.]|nr:hypothetical protein [Sulfuricurvum sp.]
MNKRDIAGYLGIDRTTLYNWEKNRPNLYKIIMQGLVVEDVKKLLKESVEKLESAGEEKKK